MTEDQNQPNGDGDNSSDNEEQKPDELQMLKQRARMMGVVFSNNIGIDALKQKIQDKMDGKVPEVEATSKPPAQLRDPSIPAPKNKGPQTLREQIRHENLRLIRLRITNMDPKKKDLPGEIFTVANEYLGTIRKFIPFGEVTENGYHVPYCIYKMMKRRKFLNIRTYKDRKNHNQIKIEQSWAQEFALEVLPPLTQTELDRLAASQSAAGGVS